MHVIHTCTIDRSTYTRSFFADVHVESTVDSSSTRFFERTRYNNTPAEKAAAACGCGARREEAGIRFGERVGSAERSSVCAT